MTITVGHVPTADELNALGWKLLARGRRTSNSTSTTTEVGVLRIDDIPIEGGHAIGIMTSGLAIHSGTATDAVRARLRATTDGSTPTTSSTEIGQTQNTIENSTHPPIQTIITSYYPASDETLSVLLTVARQTGAGNADILGASTIPIDVYIFDMGEDPGDVGVDI